MKRKLLLAAALAAFLCLVLYARDAAEGARASLTVCAAALLPSLLPFFTLSNLLSSLGLAQALDRLAGGAMRRLFHVSGPGAQAFFLGLTGGYPLGAAVTAELRRTGQISREEAERLLAFCNNSGPAFLIGAAGAVFQSAGAGVLLYAAHAAAAVATGVLLRPGAPCGGSAGPSPQTAAGPLSRLLPEALSRAVSSSVGVCGYVVFFGAMLGAVGRWLPPCGPLRTLIVGFVELGSGIASLAGTAPTPESLAEAAFLLGWGGLSVHCQTLGAVAGTDIKCARHLAGRALHGVLSAVFAFLLGLLFFRR